MVNRENDLVAEESRPNQLREELNEKMKKVDAGVMKSSSYFALEIAPL